MVKTNLNKISGWIILDKQKGVTSRQLVSKISKTLKIKKIGHGGTLDPMATGILPIALGEATKLISFGLPKFSQNFITQIAIISEKSLEIFGAVM